jgi:hypothetical protein
MLFLFSSICRFSFYLFKQCFGTRSRIDLALLDPDHFDADPDPAFHFEADPDPASRKESQLGLFVLSCLVFVKGKLITLACVLQQR